MRSALILTTMMLATLASPGISWNTGDAELDAMLEEIMDPLGIAAAADFESDTSMDPLDHVEVMLSSEVGENIRLIDGFEDNDDEEDDWCMGDYFMLNITRRFSYFAVCWGSEDNPGPVTIAALEVQYLGGIDLHDFPVEGMSVPGVPLPVATVFATSLAHMIEFEDTGTPDDPANTSGNGVFDFTRSGEGLTDFEMNSAENVLAGADISNLDWDMSGDGIEEWSDGNEMGWNFTLEASNVPYDNADGWWLTDDGSDDVLERVAYTFHIGVSIDPVTDEVIHWWDVSLNVNENFEEDAEGECYNEETNDYTDCLPFEIESIGETQELTWSGVRVAPNFKYDQTIEGWDFHSEDSLLMVESVIVRGSFTFGIIGDFLDAAAGDELGVFEENMAFDVDAENEAVLGTGDVSGVNKVSGTDVEWRHNYRKVHDKLHWIDTAEVGDSADNLSVANVTFQLHGSEAFQEHNPAVSVSLYVALGGTIYPAEEYIFHDPGYSSIISIIQLGGALLSGEIVCLQFVGVGLIGMLAMIGITVKRRRLKKTLEDHKEAPAQAGAPVGAPSAPVAAPPSDLPQMI